MAGKVEDKLGKGLFSVGEAALYARVAPAMVSRWLFGSNAGDPVLEPQFGRGEKLVSFLDLVQTLAIRELRIQKNLPLQKFREAVQYAKVHHDLDYPFARKHCTYLLGDTIVIRPDPDTPDFVEASGKQRGQRLFSFVEMYLEDLSFDRNGLASELKLYTSKDAVKILMNPAKRFGEPLLPSGYTASTIRDAIKIEGGIDQAAKAYGIPRAEVEASYRFYNEFLGKTAA